MNWKKLLVGMVFVGFASVLYVDNVIKINKLAKEILQLKDNLSKVKEKNILLTKRINELESPDRIIQLAIQKYGMKFPNKAAKKLE